MAIPSETIEQVAAANDIVEVIGTYFPLKRAGASFKALCPFHQEKTRGISREVAKSWKLGYAPESWDAFCQWASNEGYRRRELLSSGLVKLRDEERGDGEFYDRFRGRLIFPICNDVGEVIAFSGRV